MADVTRTGNPFFDAWMDAGRRFLEPVGQSNPMTAMIGGAGMSDAVARAQETWELCQRQTADWVKASSRLLSSGAASDGGDGIAEETLRKMMDPTRFLYAGTDEINQAIQRLVEGPEFADIGTIERQVLKATREWMALREASAAYRGVTVGGLDPGVPDLLDGDREEPRSAAAGLPGRPRPLARHRQRRADPHPAHRRLPQGAARAALGRRRLPAQGARAGRGLVRDPLDPDPHRGRRPAPHRARAAPPGARADRPPRRPSAQPDAPPRAPAVPAGRTQAAAAQARRARPATERPDRCPSRHSAPTSPGARPWSSAPASRAAPRPWDASATPTSTSAPPPKTQAMRVEKVTLHHYDPLPGRRGQDRPGADRLRAGRPLHDGRPAGGPLAGPQPAEARRRPLGGRLGPPVARRPVPDHRQLRRLVPRRLRRAHPRGGRRRQGDAARHLRGRHLLDALRRAACREGREPDPDHHPDRLPRRPRARRPEPRLHQPLDPQPRRTTTSTG